MSPPKNLPITAALSDERSSRPMADAQSERGCSRWHRLRSVQVCDREPRRPPTCSRVDVTSLESVRTGVSASAVEAFVWWGLQGHVPAVVGTVSTWVYLLIAFVLLPTYVPLAVMAIEPAGTHRRLIAVFAVVGAIVSALLFAAMIRGPVTAELADWHVEYLAAIIVIAIFAINGFASLWCSWAAITSAAFALHLRLADPGDAAAARPSPALGGAS